MGSTFTVILVGLAIVLAARRFMRDGNGAAGSPPADSYAYDTFTDDHRRTDRNDTDAGGASESSDSGSGGGDSGGDGGGD
ncbi:MAG: hypothetical protein R3D02_00820 [Hyphomicrobiales bacterium]